VKDSLRTIGLPVSSPPIARGAAGDDVEHAARQAGALREFGQRQRGERRLLGRLHDHRAAGGQRRRDLARDHRRREVPRRDGGADADRLLERRRCACRPAGGGITSP
jgi:hypothetical protein